MFPLFFGVLVSLICVLLFYNDELSFVENIIAWIIGTTVALLLINFTKYFIEKGKTI